MCAATFSRSRVLPVRSSAWLLALAVCAAPAWGQQTAASSAASPAAPKAAPAKAAASNDASKQAQSLALADFNAATDSPVLKPGSNGAAVARAQILLSRSWFSPGEIDGHFGRNMQRIVSAFQGARGLPKNGTVDEATWKALRQDTTPLLAEYTISKEDAAGPFVRIPAARTAQAKLKAMPYQSIDEMLGEKFHVSPRWLQRLNPGKKLVAGTTIVVPNVVGTDKAPAKAASILIDKSDYTLFLLGEDGKTVVGAFPVSIGGSSDPLPVGTLAIQSEVRNPDYSFDPKLLKKVSNKHPKLRMAPGPNNPVGTLWLGLSKPHWGIHGTPNPSKVGHAESNGCIRLTNWDVARVAELVDKGFKVVVQA